MVVSRDDPFRHVVESSFDKFVLLSRLVANVPSARLGDVGTNEVQLENMLVRQAVSYVGNRLADLQEMPQTEATRHL